MKNKLYYQFSASCLLLIFMVLTYLVKFYPDTLAVLDRFAARWLRNPLTPAKTTFFIWVTKFGNAVVVILVSLAVLYLLWQRKNKIGMLWLSINLSSALILQLIFKTLVHRPRPALEQLVPVTLSSFPSGHALGSVLCYGTIFLLLPSLFSSKIGCRLIKIGLSILILFIGLSRVYLGVHHFSDVLGGFSLGLAWLLGGYPIYQEQRVVFAFHKK